MPLAEVAAHVGEGDVGDFGSGRHGVGERKRSALWLAEKGRGLPVAERCTFLLRQALRCGKGWDMLPKHVVDAIQKCDADDDDLAQPTVESGLPTHCIQVLEPSRGQTRRVQEKLVDIEELAAPSA